MKFPNYSYDDVKEMLADIALTIRNKHYAYTKMLKRKTILTIISMASCLITLVFLLFTVITFYIDKDSPFRTVSFGVMLACLPIFIVSYILLRINSRKMVKYEEDNADDIERLHKKGFTNGKRLFKDIMEYPLTGMLCLLGLVVHMDDHLLNGCGLARKLSQLDTVKKYLKDADYSASVKYNADNKLFTILVLCKGQVYFSTNISSKHCSESDFKKAIDGDFSYLDNYIEMLRAA